MIINSNPSTKDMLYEISSMRSRAKKLLRFNTNSKYKELLTFIINEDYYHDEDKALPTIKDLSKVLSLSYDKVRSQIKAIHDDLNDEIILEKIPFEFNQSKIIFVINGYQKTTSMSANNLTVIPREGENINIPFFKSIVGTNCFYVDKVSHEFTDNKQEVYIHLEAGFYNSYWKIRKDRALITREISINDYYTKSDYQIQQLLEMRPFSAW